MVTISRYIGINPGKAETETVLSGFFYAVNSLKIYRKSLLAVGIRKNLSF